MASEPTETERELLRFLDEDATFDVMLHYTDLNDDERIAIDHLVELEFVRIDNISRAIYMDHEGMDYMIAREKAGGWPPLPDAKRLEGDEDE